MGQIAITTSEDFAYIIAWITILIKDENDKKLSQWIVWLETKTKNKQYI